MVLCKLSFPPEECAAMSQPGGESGHCTVGSNLGQVDIGRPIHAVREFSWYVRYTDSDGKTGRAETELGKILVLVVDREPVMGETRQSQSEGGG